MSDVPPTLKLDLADGRRWLIRPVDDKAAAVVAELGKAMRLNPGKVGRELCVAVCGEFDGSDRTNAESRGAVLCVLADASQGPQASSTDRDMQVIRMARIASLIAREALVRGGLLLHAALAEYQGNGFIMVGPGAIGKSTASRRLPSPWRSLCDDMTLVVRDEKGRYWAHPWPTWSLFFGDGPGGSWAVEHAVPLRAIFFLTRSPTDRLEPITSTQATALTIESARDLVREASRLTEGNAARALCSAGVRAARALTLAVPAFSLKLSLDGRFWEEIERVLPVGGLQGSGGASHGQGPESVESPLADHSLRVVYTGPSMNPTLREPDLLEVKPHGTGRVSPGDVVCFKSPETGTTVVHRVVAADSDGIRTRGDNNTESDPWLLQSGEIIGCVKAVQRGTRRRAVFGGRRGLLVLRWARLGQGIRRCLGSFPHKLYSLLAGIGPFDRLLPARLRPRLVRFDVRCRVFLKLLMGRQTVGQYDDQLGTWRIRRPFRLFVNEQTIREAASLASRDEMRD